MARQWDGALVVVSGREADHRAKEGSEFAAEELEGSEVVGEYRRIVANGC